MCHFDQICTNNLSSYSETGKESKKEPGPVGKSKPQLESEWEARSAGVGLPW